VDHSTIRVLQQLAERLAELVVAEMVAVVLLTQMQPLAP
jgi:hypothetical protein